MLGQQSHSCPSPVLFLYLSKETEKGRTERTQRGPISPGVQSRGVTVVANSSIRNVSRKLGEKDKAHSQVPFTLTKLLEMDRRYFYVCNLYMS